MCVNYNCPLPASAQTPEQQAEDIRIDIQIRKNLINKKQETIEKLKKDIEELQQKLAELLAEEERKDRAQMTIDDILGGNE